MPFTISHAAAVLPLHALSKSRLPLSALMIGSMSPDFSYFIPPAPALPTHTLAGLFWFCWPTGLLAWLVFVCLLERPTVGLLPDSWQRQIPASEKITASLLVRVSIALVLGAATHVIWDSFTHRATPVTAALPLLRMEVMRIGQASVPLFKFLQHLSTIVGFALLVFWAWSRFGPGRRPLASTTSARDRLSSPYALSSAMRIGAVAAMLTVSGAAAVLNYALHTQFRLERRLYHFAIGGMSGWAVTWIAIAMLITWNCTRVGGELDSRSRAQNSQDAQDALKDAA